MNLPNDYCRGERLRADRVINIFNGAKCKVPICTLNMLQGKVYVVTSPDLLTALNRNPKAIAFNPFIAQLGKRITGHDEATGKIVQHNLNGEQGSRYVIEVHDGIVAALAPLKTW